MSGRDLVVISTLISLAFSSCATDRGGLVDDDTNTLPGMVYDGRNHAVENALVYVGDEFQTETDVNGRFFVRLPFGSYELRIEREGYEPIAVELDYSSIGQVVHVRMTSYSELIDDAAESIERRRWADAESLLGRAKALEPDSPETRYLRAIVAYKRGDEETAIAELNELLSGGYDDPYVYLLLADIYQYRLDDQERAISLLEAVLRKVGSSQVAARLEELQRDLENTP